MTLSHALGAVLFATGVFAGCGEVIGVDGGVPELPTCVFDEDCAPGRVCAAGVCRDQCSSDAECRDGHRCTAGACLPGESSVAGAGGVSGSGGAIEPGGAAGTAVAGAGGVGGAAGEPIAGASGVAGTQTGGTAGAAAAAGTSGLAGMGGVAGSPVIPATVPSCYPCTVDAECLDYVLGHPSWCVEISPGRSMCLPIPTDTLLCPANLIPQVVRPPERACVPPTAACCIDDDGDHYGEGLDCLGPDCNDDFEHCTNDCTNSDGDTYCDENDNCPDVDNENQINTDRDLEEAGLIQDGDVDGDACDLDDDNDGVLDDGGENGVDGDEPCGHLVTVGCDDNCPLTPNGAQGNQDGVGAGDACADDQDGDGIPNEHDNCPTIYNPGQEDLDGDWPVTSCPADCGYCGDGACGRDEIAANAPDDCPADCPANCGDGSCDGAETESNCAFDCATGACGDGTCAAGEGQQVVRDNCLNSIPDPISCVDLPCHCGGDACDGDEDGDNDPDTDDCADRDPTRSHFAPERCNLIDDDCDGRDDEADAGIDTLCPLTDYVATRECTVGGYCRTLTCIPRYGDLDGEYDTGCECAPDAHDAAESNNTCATAVDLGEVLDNSTTDFKRATGKLSTPTDVDYYYVRAVDINPAGSDEKFHVDIRFISNPGNEFRFRVWRHATLSRNCTQAPCGANTYVTGTDCFNWATNFRTSPSTSGWGEDGCINSTSDYDTRSTRQLCTDNTAYFVVEVSRASAVTTCSEYTLQIRNQDLPFAAGTCAP